MSAPHKLSPTWPTPRVRDASPPILAAVACLHLVVTAAANASSGWGDDEIGQWVLVTAGSAAVATAVWVALCVRLDVGRPGWKRLPRFTRVDPDSLPRRPLRRRWLLWYVPLWAAVTLGSLLLTPGVDNPFVDLVLLTVASGLVQVIAVLLTVLALGFLLMPVVLVAVGCRRLDDGDGLPPTGPVLVSTGLALVLTVPCAVGLTTMGGDVPWSVPARVWSVLTTATTAALLLNLVFLALYGLSVRDRDQRRTPATRG